MNIFNVKGWVLMDTRLKDISKRIRSLRDILDITPEEMAEKTGVSLEDYNDYENAVKDFSFTFLYDCANIFGVDIVELLTGENPRLSFYTIVRSGQGLPMRRRHGFTYRHLAYHMKDKLTEPFLVTAPYYEDEQDKAIETSSHKGQEFDYILSGSLKVRLDDHTEVLSAGDAILYDSGHQHGMIAVDGEDCTFLALVMKDPGKDSTENV
jgi:transcriptional regulator with XRE-family HTH domain